MHIPKQEDFAVLFMSELGRVYAKQILPVSEIALRHGVSPFYLKKIVRLLRQKGLVASREGVGGGYMLTKDPQEISVWEIMNAVSDESGLISQTQICPLYSACLPAHIKKTIRDSLEKSLTEITLANLIGTS